MAAQILDGRSLAAQICAAVKDKVDRLADRGVRPGLAVVLAGNDAASRVYVRNKLRACQQAGIAARLIELADTVSEQAVLDKLCELNADPAVHGILVQLPLPRGLDTPRVLNAVSPAKDVDGFHDTNLGALAAGHPVRVPCTPAGVLRLLDSAGVPLRGRRAVVIGRSTIVGRPLALLLLARDATVTVCHSRTTDLAELTRHADVLVAAAGQPKLVGPEMVKPGACVIDVGMNRLPDGALAGDVDFEPVKNIAGWITPVPGGVGPMTVAMLLENCFASAANS